MKLLTFLQNYNRSYGRDMLYFYPLKVVSSQFCPHIQWFKSSSAYQWKMPQQPIVGPMLLYSFELKNNMFSFQFISPMIFLQLNPLITFHQASLFRCLKRVAFYRKSFRCPCSNTLRSAVSVICLQELQKLSHHLPSISVSHSAHMRGGEVLNNNCASFCYYYVAV